MDYFKNGKPVPKLFLWKGRRVEEFTHEELISEFNDLARMYQRELDGRRARERASVSAFHELLSRG